MNSSRTAGTSESERRVDRFVMPRESLPHLQRRFWLADREPQPVDIWHPKSQQQRQYKSLLDEAFGLNPTRRESFRSAEGEYWVQPWPCKPRKKRSCLSHAESNLDLSSYSSTAFSEVIDWSSKDVLVVAQGEEHYMFDWKVPGVHEQGMTAAYDIQCCKFDPRGELLLFGLEMKTVELHHCSTESGSKNAIAGRCECVCTAPCSITCLDWSPTGNSFVVGCSRGLVTTFERTAVRIKTSQGKKRAPVLAVRVSPDCRYVAATITNSSKVHVYVWPSLEYHLSLQVNGIAKTLTWHPWRTALLGVGTMTRSRHMAIALWDTASTRFREVDLGHRPHTIDAMMFSHKTGELVLSLWDSDTASAFPTRGSQLVVLSDPHTVVGQTGESSGGLNRIRAMVFSPDGTKLATPTSDEDLIIWNFLPEEKNNKKSNTKSKKLCALPVYLDELTHGFTLR